MTDRRVATAAALCGLSLWPARARADDRVAPAEAASPPVAAAPDAPPTEPASGAPAPATRRPTPAAEAPPEAPAATDVDASNDTRQSTDARQPNDTRRSTPVTPAAPVDGDEGAATVVGSHRGGLDRLPGSASLVRREDLRNLAPQHGGDALRTVPGVNVAGEDPMGLRLNIGIRGLDPNRSRKVLILEDGIPLSLNPYGAPELYYTPPIERMDRIEVVRGSGQILWGPQTIGGVINYITREPPQTPTGGVALRLGDQGYFMLHGYAGATHGPVGWQLDVIHRRFDGVRDLNLALTDVTARMRLNLSSRATLRLKFSFYDESSQATYLGLTTAQFGHDPATSLGDHDLFQVRRHALAVVHQYRLSANLRLQTSLYGYETDRAWRRQEFDREPSTAAGVEYERVCDGLGVCRAPGDPGIVNAGRGTLLYFRQSAAIRHRRFEVAGFEPRLTWTWQRGSVEGELIAVGRALYEQAHDQIYMTSRPNQESGDVRDEERRNGYAFSAAVQHRFSFSRRVHVTPGLRVENYLSDRTILRVPQTDAMGVTRGADTLVRGSAFSSAVIPGLGVAVDLSRATTVYTGVHRGYAPPRSRDAVSAAGANLNLDAELSWNAELGMRLRAGRWFNLDVAGFLLEFSNQIIPPSESGATVSGGNFNSGKSRHIGTEASLVIDPFSRGRGSSFAMPLMVSYTWVPVADFTAGLFNRNRLPYAPEHLLNVQLRFVHRAGVAAQVGVNYLSSQFADRENTQAPSPDGLIGALPASLTLDARLAYTLRRSGITVALNGRNLTNQAYIANRAPQGIQPAGFRQVFASLEWQWPAR
ncbi:MAG: TonB-dependent receptor [Myxococcales bacterium]|nr:TonB-dependent receptor [Myxococcales bacterium]